MEETTSLANKHLDESFSTESIEEEANNLSTDELPLVNHQDDQDNHHNQHHHHHNNMSNSSLIQEAAETLLEIKKQRETSDEMLNNCNNMRSTIKNGSRNNKTANFSSNITSNTSPSPSSSSRSPTSSSSSSVSNYSEQHQHGKAKNEAAENRSNKDGGSMYGLEENFEENKSSNDVEDVAVSENETLGKEKEIGGSNNDDSGGGGGGNDEEDDREQSDGDDEEEKKILRQLQHNDESENEGAYNKSFLFRFVDFCSCSRSYLVLF